MKAAKTTRTTKRQLLLRLYVAGDAPNSVRAVGNIKSICASHFASRSTLEIVDLLANPRRALADGIVVTPTLLRLEPLPVQRIIGDLRDLDQVLLALGDR